MEDMGVCSGGFPCENFFGMLLRLHRKPIPFLRNWPSIKVWNTLNFCAYLHYSDFLPYHMKSFSVKALVCRHACASNLLVTLKIDLCNKNIRKDLISFIAILFPSVTTTRDPFLWDKNGFILGGTVAQGFLSALIFRE